MAYDVQISELRKYAKEISGMPASNDNVTDAIDRLTIGIVLTGAAIAERLETMEPDEGGEN